MQQIPVCANQCNSPFRREFHFRKYPKNCVRFLVNLPIEMSNIFRYNDFIFRRYFMKSGEANGYDHRKKNLRF